jgi:hypothetical protein
VLSAYRVRISAADSQAATAVPIPLTTAIVYRAVSPSTLSGSTPTRDWNTV